MIWLIATLVVYYSARAIALKCKNPLVNPLLISLLVLIPLLIYLKVPYEHYFAQNKVINYLLGPAVVALAYPLYEQLEQIKAKWKTIFTVCLIGSSLSMFIGASIARLMGLNEILTASILPKSVTTPIAMAVSHQIGGIPAITAVMVIMAGLFGSVVGYPILKALRIRPSIAKGLTMGTVSHALGTAKAAEENFQEGAFSSLALVICGIFTSILAPFILPIVFHIFG